LAQADVRTATVNDPQDAPAPAAGAARDPDLKSLKVTYNSIAGTVVATATFYESIAARTAETNISFDLGGRPATTGFDCEVGAATTISAFMFAKQGTGLMTVDGYDALITQSGASLSADGLTFTVTFVRPAALAGLDLRCANVLSVWTSKYTDPTCTYFDCAVTKIDLDPVYKNAWFDGFAPTPAAPTNVTVADATGSSVAVQWKDDDPSITGYEVLRDGQVVGTTSSTSFTVPGLSCGKSYTLSVRADTPYTHSADATVSARTAVCAPKSPAHVKVVGTTATTLTISWGARANVTQYVVQVGSHSGQTTATHLTVAGLRCGTRYTVVVRAVGPGGKSAPATVAGRTRPC
ncbi:MAG: cellulose 1,4-beta-cellobiosidase, partial [Gaiellaceae bacterium]|nr:cellulose 1,4-beta-cellobiosidase [Gaiellaceae bacterium]